MGGKQDGGGSGASQSDKRARRLEEQLRSNLRKRKDQARARSEQTGGSNPDETSPASGAGDGDDE